jgi:hypothetical protein
MSAGLVVKAWSEETQGWVLVSRKCADGGDARRQADQERRERQAPVRVYFGDLVIYKAE